MKLSERVSLSQYKHEISELIFSLHCNLSHLSLECEYNVHGTYEFFLWTVYWLSFLFWWLWYWLDVKNFNYSFSKPSCLISIFTLCVVKVWKIETLHTSLLQRDAVECHAVVCAITQQVGRLRFWNGYPHPPSPRAVTCPFPSKQ